MGDDDQHLRTSGSCETLETGGVDVLQRFLNLFMVPVGLRRIHLNGEA